VLSDLFYNYWAMISVVLAMALSYYLGRRVGRKDRQEALHTLLAIASITRDLTTDVENRNTELATVEGNVEQIECDGQVETVQQLLLKQITEVVSSNKKLRDDLVCARYAFEDQAQELDRTRVIARTDKLSGVANRHSFDETFEYWVSAGKKRRSRFGLLLADVDHFKWINDTHGHQSGDLVVSHIGKTLCDVVNRRDFVSRYGGDEFAVLLRGEVDALREKAEEIRVAVENNTFDVRTSGARISVTFSIGLAMFHSEDTVDTLLSRADAALYRSKQGGRNQMRFMEWEPDTDTTATLVDSRTSE